MKPPLFVELEADSDFIICFRHSDHLGPLVMPPDGPGRFLLFTGSMPAPGTRPSDTARQKLADGNAVWVETATLAECRARAIQSIDAAGEALRMAVINHMPTQTEEYRQVLQQAQGWRAAGYPETDEQPAPPDVVSWAMAKWREGWTARQAADDVLRVADQWAAVVSRIRMLRLVNKEDVRHETDTGAVAAIVNDMRTDMRTLAAQMNLTITE